MLYYCFLYCLLHFSHVSRYPCELRLRSEPMLSCRARTLLARGITPNRARGRRGRGSRGGRVSVGRGGSRGGQAYADSLAEPAMAAMMAMAGAAGGPGAYQGYSSMRRGGGGQHGLYDGKKTMYCGNPSAMHDDKLSKHMSGDSKSSISDMENNSRCSSSILDKLDPNYSPKDGKRSPSPSSADMDLIMNAVDLNDSDYSWLIDIGADIGTDSDNTLNDSFDLFGSGSEGGKLMDFASIANQIMSESGEDICESGEEQPTTPHNPHNSMPPPPSPAPRLPPSPLSCPSPFSIPCLTPQMTPSSPSPIPSPMASPAQHSTNSYSTSNNNRDSTNHTTTEPDNRNNTPNSNSNNNTCSSSVNNPNSPSNIASPNNHNSATSPSDNIVHSNNNPSPDDRAGCSPSAPEPGDGSTVSTTTSPAADGPVASPSEAVSIAGDNIPDSSSVTQQDAAFNNATTNDWTESNSNNEPESVASPSNCQTANSPTDRCTGQSTAKVTQAIITDSAADSDGPLPKESMDSCGEDTTITSALADTSDFNNRSPAADGTPVGPRHESSDVNPRHINSNETSSADIDCATTTCESGEPGQQQPVSEPLLPKESGAVVVVASLDATCKSSPDSTLESCDPSGEDKSPLMGACVSPTGDSGVGSSHSAGEVTATEHSDADCGCSSQDEGTNTTGSGTPVITENIGDDGCTVGTAASPTMPTLSSPGHATNCMDTDDVHLCLGGNSTATKCNASNPSSKEHLSSAKQTLAKDQSMDCDELPDIAGNNDNAGCKPQRSPEISEESKLLSDASISNKANNQSPEMPHLSPHSEAGNKRLENDNNSSHINELLNKNEHQFQNSSVGKDDSMSHLDLHTPSVTKSSPNERYSSESLSYDHNLRSEATSSESGIASDSSSSSQINCGLTKCMSPELPRVPTAGGPLMNTSDLGTVQSSDIGMDCGPNKWLCSAKSNTATALPASKPGPSIRNTTSSVSNSRNKRSMQNSSSISSIQNTIEYVIMKTKHSNTSDMGSNSYSANCKDTSIFKSMHSNSRSSEHITKKNPDLERYNSSLNQQSVMSGMNSPNCNSTVQCGSGIKSTPSGSQSAVYNQGVHTQQQYQCSQPYRGQREAPYNQFHPSIKHNPMAASINDYRQNMVNNNASGNYNNYGNHPYDMNYHSSTGTSGVRNNGNGPPSPQSTIIKYSENLASFSDSSIGGVAIALSHGSVLFECAKHELHATTALKTPDRRDPKRISLVFYQHKNLIYRNHGAQEFEARMERKKLEMDRLIKEGKIEPSPRKRKQMIKEGFVFPDMMDKESSSTPGLESNPDSSNGSHNPKKTPASESWSTSNNKRIKFEVPNSPSTSSSMDQQLPEPTMPTKQHLLSPRTQNSPSHHPQCSPHPLQSPRSQQLSPHPSPLSQMSPHSLKSPYPQQSPMPSSLPHPSPNPQQQPGGPPSSHPYQPSHMTPSGHPSDSPLHSSSLSQHSPHPNQSPHPYHSPRPSPLPLSQPHGSPHSPHPLGHDGHLKPGYAPPKNLHLGYHSDLAVPTPGYAGYSKPLPAFAGVGRPYSPGGAPGMPPSAAGVATNTGSSAAMSSTASAYSMTGPGDGHLGLDQRYQRPTGPPEHMYHRMSMQDPHMYPQMMGMRGKMPPYSSSLQEFHPYQSKAGMTPYHLQQQYGTPTGYGGMNTPSGGYGSSFGSMCNPTPGMTGAGGGGAPGYNQPGPAGSNPVYPVGSFGLTPPYSPGPHHSPLPLHPSHQTSIPPHPPYQPSMPPHLSPRPPDTSSHRPRTPPVHPTPTWCQQRPNPGTHVTGPYAPWHGG